MANVSALIGVLACCFLLSGIHGVANQTGAGLFPIFSVFNNLQTSNEHPSLDKFVGTWEGKCQDGRTFVVLALKQNGNQLAGTVSIGNMHGDDEGACMMVLAPPTPEHAQQIGNAAAKQGTLAFNGAKRPDGTFTRFEFSVADNGPAQLKLLGSPVENHPWQLAKASSTSTR
jgi:hypothetical protein